jgi:upstream-binding transcription factor
MWQKVSLRQRRFRLLKELLDDAKTWVEQPWTNFYRSQKTNRHPDMPKRPLSTYMMFYMEKKDRVSKEYPSLEMVSLNCNLTLFVVSFCCILLHLFILQTKLSTIIAAMYKNLPDKQKQKYTEKAKVQRDEFNDKMTKF